MLCRRCKKDEGEDDTATISSWCCLMQHYTIRPSGNAEVRRTSECGTRSRLESFRVRLRGPGRVLRTAQRLRLRDSRVPSRLAIGSEVVANPLLPRAGATGEWRERECGPRTADLLAAESIPRRSSHGTGGGAGSVEPTGCGHFGI